MPEIDKNIWLAFTIFFWRFLRVCDAVWRFVITRAAVCVCVCVCVRHTAGVCNQISVLFQWGLRWELISHYTFIPRSIPTAGNTYTHTHTHTHMLAAHLSRSVCIWVLVIEQWCVSVCVTDQRSPAPLKQDLHDHGWDSCEERRLERRREVRKDETGKDMKRWDQKTVWQNRQRQDESNKMRNEETRWEKQEKIIR